MSGQCDAEQNGHRCWSFEGHPGEHHAGARRWKPSRADATKELAEDLRAQVATLTKERDSARAQALEEAARAAERVGALRTADAIRALASPGGRP